MSQPNHISRITTIWTELALAHGSDADLARRAQGKVVERYSPSIYRYLHKVLGDANSADEVFQEFALLLVKGSFAGADPDRGRFRDYLKVSLLRLVTKYRRRVALANEVKLDFDAIDERISSDFDQAFRESCRDELLATAWKRLQDEESRSDNVGYSVLRYRSIHPQQTSDQAALDLSEQLDRDLTAASVRKSLQRAREQFAKFLWEETGKAISDPDATAIESELGELGLLSWCRPALDRRRKD